MAQRGPGKRFLDIEQALRWAYRDELPKRQYGDDRPDMTEPGLDDFADSGGEDDKQTDRAKWRIEPGYPAAVGAPHGDARAIEQAVRGLATWRGHGFGPGDDPAGLMHGFDLTAWHGHIDHVAAGMEAVANMAAIIAVHARAGTRPKWSRHIPEPLPVKGKNGKEKVLIDETFIEKVDRKGVYYEPTDIIPPGAITHVMSSPCSATRAGRYREGAYCPLVYRPRPAGLVTERAEYAAWRMGLELLHLELEGKLSSIAPLPPAAPWRPWCGETEAHGRPPELFKGQRDEPYRRETREQQAAKRRSATRRQLSDRGEETRPVRPRRRDGGANVA